MRDLENGKALIANPASIENRPVCGNTSTEASLHELRSPIGENQWSSSCRASTLLGACRCSALLADAKWAATAACSLRDLAALYNAAITHCCAAIDGYCDSSRIHAA